jgi:hypothetical protein
MEKEFVSYEQALALKKLGFSEPCLGTYYYAGKVLDISEYINHGKYTVLAPLKQQVFRWFREKYGIWSFTYPSAYGKDWKYHIQKWSNLEKWGEVWEGNSYYTYEEAENACIDKLIEIAKK